MSPLWFHIEVTIFAGLCMNLNLILQDHHANDPHHCSTIITIVEANKQTKVIH